MSKQENNSGKLQLVSKDEDNLLKTAAQKMMMLGAEEDYVKREIGFAKQYFEKNPKLQECTYESALQAIINTVRADVTLNPSLQLAYLVPRKVGKKMLCILDFGYRGLIDILHKAGSIKRIGANVVYKDEVDIGQFSYDPVMRTANHVPVYAKTQSEHEKREVYGAYSTAILPDGTLDVEFMPIWELEKIQRSSSSNESQYSPHKIWVEEMYKKTVCRRHFKWLPKTKATEIVTQALEMDLQNSEVDPVKAKGSKGVLTEK